MFFIRHGEADYSEKDTKIYQGFGMNLSKLSKTGIYQIEQTAKDERLQRANLILSSPYTRALQTAAILSAKLNIQIAIETDLHEWIANKDYIYETNETAQIYYLEYKKWAGQYPAGEERPWETAACMKKRVEHVLSKYGNYEPIIVVCHQMLIQAATGIQQPIACGEIVEYHFINES